MSFQRSIICPNTFRGFRGRIGKQKNGKFRFSSPRVDMGTAITPLESYELTGFLRICTTTIGTLQVFHYDTRRRIKSWNSGSVPIVVVHILKNPVNSYDSNGVIAVPISTLGDEKRNLPFFCLPILPRNPLNVLGHIIRRWKDNLKENTTPLES